MYSCKMTYTRSDILLTCHSLFELCLRSSWRGCSLIPMLCRLLIIKVCYFRHELKYLGGQCVGGLSACNYQYRPMVINNYLYSSAYFTYRIVRYICFMYYSCPSIQVFLISWIRWTYSLRRFRNHSTCTWKRSVKSSPGSTSCPTMTCLRFLVKARTQKPWVQKSHEKWMVKHIRVSCLLHAGTYHVVLVCVCLTCPYMHTHKLVDYGLWHSVHDNTWRFSFTACL